jgi:integrase
VQTACRKNVLNRHGRPGRGPQETDHRQPVRRDQGPVAREREPVPIRDPRRAERLLAACPDGQWRLIVALSRYGGLRCPSETLALTWGDVDWDRGRIRVPSSKTERYKGKAFREIPLFPELRQHLEEAFDAAEPGTVHVITRYRDATGNLRT